MANLEIYRPLTTPAIERRGTASLGADLLPSRPEWVSGNISDYDARFLAGLANFANPRNVVEIGVASGWSSAILLKCLSALDGDRKVTGIDLSPTYYLDSAIPTGQAVQEAVPELTSSYRLLTGKLAVDVMEEVGAVDFAFIDGHHMHPWATLDMLSVLPFMSPSRWVALHDLNLCTFERHKHTNRAPFYLFYMWPDQKLHSTQNPAMIGAVLLERAPIDYLPTLLEILYTPWEVDVDAATCNRFAAFILKHFGEEWRLKFLAAFQVSRARFAA